MTTNNLTVISRNNTEYLLRKNPSPEEMVRFLEDGAMFRRFPDVLRRVYPGEDLSERLTRRLTEMTGDNRESVARSVRNWLNGAAAPQNREQLFQIGFALGLDEEKTEALLSSASEMGIHYRDPGEMVMAYALRTGKDYGEALALRERMLDLCSRAPAPEGRPARYTRQIRAEFADVTTDKELADFMEAFGGELGELHETAYRRFTELLEQLQNPTGALEMDEESLSVEDLMEDYFQMSVPSTKKSGQFSYLQKVVKKNWPNASSILKMKNRKMDVSRKMLLLLYLVTECFDDVDEESPEYALIDDCDYSEENPNDRLEERLEKIDLYLNECGMNLLDPGNPFDCLVLYALKTRYDEFASDKLGMTLELLFPEREP